MSLQVWLPLNGTLENKGLDDIEFASTTASGYEDGKIGKALQMKNSYVDFTVPSLIDAKTFSVAFWYKAISDSSITTAWNKVIRFPTKNADGTTGSDFRFESSYGDNFTNRYALSVHNNTSQSLGSVGHQIVALKGEWHHACLPHTPEQNLTYRDGVLITTGVGAAGTINGRVMIAANAAYPNGLMNDFRLYDHCLSEKEVKELSKGLVAHYPLNDYPITNFSGEGNIMPNYKDMGLWPANPSTGTWRLAGTSNMTRSRIQITDSPVGSCYCFQNVGIQTADAGSCYGIDSFPLEADTEYRISMFARMTDGSDGYAGFNVYSISSELGGSHTGIQKNYRTTPLNADGSWTYCWYHIKTNSSTKRNIYIGIVTGEISVTTQMCLVRIEKWQDWFDDTTIYDTSGYGHNGSIVGDVSSALDTPRYQTGAHLNSSNLNAISDATTAAYIKCPLELTNPTSITVSLWAKIDGSYNGGSHALISSSETTTPTDYLKSTFNHRDSLFDVNSSDGASHIRPSMSFTMGKWTHYALTYDGQTAKTYRDSVLISTVAFPSATELGSMTSIFIGLSVAGRVWRKILGDYSDVRIYCTALSPEDIKELYEVSASVDNKGNVYAHELVES